MMIGLEKHFTIVLLISILFTFHSVLSKGKDCNLFDTVEENQCGLHEDCVELDLKSNIGECRCSTGYKRNEAGNCILKEDNVVDEDGGNLGLTIFLWVFFVLLVIVCIYFYRYRVIDWIRYKFNQRYSKNYDDVMIGQDD